MNSTRFIPAMVLTVLGGAAFTHEGCMVQALNRTHDAQRAGENDTDSQCRGR